MKGEPGRPAGAGWAAAPGGGEAGAQGEGWARLPKRTYCPRLAAGAPPGPSGPTQRRHLSPAAGSACLLLGAKAHRLELPLPPPLAPVSRRGLPGTRRGSRKKLCRESLRFWKGGEGLGEFGGSQGRLRRVPRAHTPNSSGLQREGAAARSGRACVGTRCHPWRLVSAQALRPPALAAQRPRAAARQSSAASPHRFPPRPLPKVPGPSLTGFFSVPRLPRRPPAAAAHPHLILKVVDLQGAVEVRRH